MIIPDVNILVAAFRGEHVHHDLANDWLRTVIASTEVVGLSSAVVSGFIRVVTNRRAFADPTELDVALGQIENLRSQVGVIDVAPGPKHWEIFSSLCRDADARGALVSDAVHAAIAMENGATWVSMDRDFARFPGLRWELPFR